MKWGVCSTALKDAVMPAAAQDRKPYPFTLGEMVHNIEVLEAITISAEDRRTVAIKDL